LVNVAVLLHVIDTRFELSCLEINGIL